MPIADDPGKRISEDRPPFFRSWTGVYAVVLGFLGFLILAFHLFTRYYR
jgi:hypothetical protein